MQLLGNAKYKLAKNKSSLNLHQLESTEVVLIHCNIVNTDYQHDCRVFYSKHLIFLKTFNSEFFHILKYDLLTKVLKR